MAEDYATEPLDTGPDAQNSKLTPKPQPAAFKPSSKPKRNFFSRTKFYLFEYSSLQISTLWLGTGLSIAVFSLFAVVAGGSISTSVVESLAWVFGIILVFAPATVMLYARTSGEEAVNPARLHQHIRKAVFYTMLTIVIISAASLLVTAVYTASRFIFGLGDTESLVSVSIPSILVLLLHVYFVGFVIKGTVTSSSLRKMNIICISLLATLLLLTVSAMAMVSGNGVSEDKKTVKELGTTSVAINKEYKNSGTLPSNIENLSSLANNDIKTKFKSGIYTYERIPEVYYGQTVDSSTQDTSDLSSTAKPESNSSYGSSNSYKICATFRTSTNTYATDFDYSNPSDFARHSKGKECFSLYAY